MQAARVFLHPPNAREILPTTVANQPPEICKAHSLQLQSFSLPRPLIYT